MTTVVTSFGPEGYHQYGHNMLDSFAEHWPSRVDLICYREANERHPRAKMRDLLSLPHCNAFLEAHLDEPIARGLVRTPVWRNKDGQRGYSFRTDAVKFCRKVFAVLDAAERLGSGVMAWIDADVITTKTVEEGFIEGLLGDDDIAYLSRLGTHSECGFLAFRLPQAMPVIRRWASYYITDKVFELPEWHDSYVWDVALMEEPSVSRRSITPPGMETVHHVWTASPLQDVMDHLKGERKAMGFSPEARMSA